MMHIEKKPYLKISILMIAALLISSCSTHETLPDSWGIPLVTPGNTCPDISGQYMNLGQRVIDTKYPPYLYSMLLTDEEQYNNTLQQSRITHISIEQDGNNLVRFTAWMENDSVYSKRLSMKKGDFTCENGWLIISSISYAQKARTSLRKGFTKSDEYLLEKTEAEGTSLAFLFPIPFSNVYWTRFAPMVIEKLPTP